MECAAVTLGREPLPVCNASSPVHEQHRVVKIKLALMYTVGLVHPTFPWGVGVAFQ